MEGWAFHPGSDVGIGMEVGMGVEYQAGSGQPGEKSPPAPFKGGAAAGTPPRKDGGWSVGSGRDFLGAGSNGAGKGERRMGRGKMMEEEHPTKE